MPPSESLRAWERLLTMLAYVQTRTQRYGTFTIRPEVTNADLASANRLCAMCSSAQQETRMTFNMGLAAPLKVPPASNSAPELVLEIDPFGHVELFGVTVPIGRVRVTFLEPDQVMNELGSAAREARTSVTFENALVRLNYLDWVKPKNGPKPASARELVAKPVTRRAPKKTAPRTTPRAGRRTPAAKGS